MAAHLPIDLGYTGGLSYQPRFVAWVRFHEWRSVGSGDTREGVQAQHPGALVLAAGQVPENEPRRAPIVVSPPGGARRID